VKSLLLLFLLACQPALAALNLGSTDNLLEPEKAFRFSAQAVDGAVEVRFAIADGYYLYRDRMKFEAAGARLGKAVFPPGLAHKDEFFGEQQIYRKEVRVRVPAEAAGAFDLKVTSQGCADAGVCYVPMESRASLRMTGATSAAPPAAPSLSH
jgi:thiol:disulfide interchange protein DsbD